MGPLPSPIGLEREGGIRYSGVVLDPSGFHAEEPRDILLPGQRQPHLKLPERLAEVLPRQLGPAAAPKEGGEPFAGVYTMRAKRSTGLAG